MVIYTVTLMNPLASGADGSWTQDLLMECVVGELPAGSEPALAANESSAGSGRDASLHQSPEHVISATGTVRSGGGGGGAVGGSGGGGGSSLAAGDGPTRPSLPLPSPLNDEALSSTRIPRSSPLRSLSSPNVFDVDVSDDDGSDDDSDASRDAEDGDGSIVAAWSGGDAGDINLAREGDVDHARDKENEPFERPDVMISDDSDSGDVVDEDEADEKVERTAAVEQHKRTRETGSIHENGEQRQKCVNKPRTACQGDDSMAAPIDSALAMATGAVVTPGKFEQVSPAADGLRPDEDESTSTQRRKSNASDEEQKKSPVGGGSGSSRKGAGPDSCGSNSSVNGKIVGRSTDQAFPFAESPSSGVVPSVTPPSPTTPSSSSRQSRLEVMSPDSIASVEVDEDGGSDSSFRGSGSSDDEGDSEGSEGYEVDVLPPPCAIYHRQRKTFKHSLCEECYKIYTRDLEIAGAASISDIESDRKSRGRSSLSRRRRHHGENKGLRISARIASDTQAMMVSKRSRSNPFRTERQGDSSESNESADDSCDESSSGSRPSQKRRRTSIMDEMCEKHGSSRRERKQNIKNESNELSNKSSEVVDAKAGGQSLSDEDASSGRHHRGITAGKMRDETGGHTVGHGGSSTKGEAQGESKGKGSDPDTSGRVTTVALKAGIETGGSDATEAKPVKSRRSNSTKTQSRAAVEARAAAAPVTVHSTVVDNGGFDLLSELIESSASAKRTSTTAANPSSSRQQEGRAKIGKDRPVKRGEVHDGKSPGAGAAIRKSISSADGEAPRQYLQLNRVGSSDASTSAPLPRDGHKVPSSLSMAEYAAMRAAGGISGGGVWSAGKETRLKDGPAAPAFSLKSSYGKIPEADISSTAANGNVVGKRSTDQGVHQTPLSVPPPAKKGKATHESGSASHATAAGAAVDSGTGGVDGVGTKAHTAASKVYEKVPHFTGVVRKISNGTFFLWVKDKLHDGTPYDSAEACAREYDMLVRSTRGSQRGPKRNFGDARAPSHVETANLTPLSLKPGGTSRIAKKNLTSAYSSNAPRSKTPFFAPKEAAKLPLTAKDKPQQKRSGSTAPAAAFGASTAKGTGTATRARTPLPASKTKAALVPPPAVPSFHARRDFDLPRVQGSPGTSPHASKSSTVISQNSVPLSLASTSIRWARVVNTFRPVDGLHIPGGMDVLPKRSGLKGGRKGRPVPDTRLTCAQVGFTLLLTEEERKQEQETGGLVDPQSQEREKMAKEREASLHGKGSLGVGREWPKLSPSRTLPPSPSAASASPHALSSASTLVSPSEPKAFGSMSPPSKTPSAAEGGEVRGKVCSTAQPPPPLPATSSSTAPTVGARQNAPAAGAAAVTASVDAGSVVSKEERLAADSTCASRSAVAGLTSTESAAVDHRALVPPALGDSRNALVESHRLVAKEVDVAHGTERSKDAGVEKKGMGRSKIAAATGLSCDDYLGKARNKGGIDSGQVGPSRLARQPTKEGVEENRDEEQGRELLQSMMMTSLGGGQEDTVGHDHAEGHGSPELCIGGGDQGEAVTKDVTAAAVETRAAGFSWTNTRDGGGDSVNDRTDAVPFPRKSEQQKGGAQPRHPLCSEANGTRSLAVQDGSDHRNRDNADKLITGIEKLIADCQASQQPPHDVNDREKRAVEGSCVRGSESSRSKNASSRASDDVTQALPMMPKPQTAWQTPSRIRRAHAPDSLTTTGNQQVVPGAERKQAGPELRGTTLKPGVGGEAAASSSGIRPQTAWKPPARLRLAPAPKSTEAKQQQTFIPPLPPFPPPPLPPDDDNEDATQLARRPQGEGEARIASGVIEAAPPMPPSPSPPPLPPTPPVFSPPLPALPTLPSCSSPVGSLSHEALQLPPLPLSPKQYLSGGAERHPDDTDGTSSDEDDAILRRGLEEQRQQEGLEMSLACDHEEAFPPPVMTSAAAVPAEALGGSVDVDEDDPFARLLSLAQSRESVSDVHNSTPAAAAAAAVLTATSAPPSPAADASAASEIHAAASAAAAAAAAESTATSAATTTSGATDRHLPRSLSLSSAAGVAKRAVGGQADGSASDAGRGDEEVSKSRSTDGQRRHGSEARDKGWERERRYRGRDSSTGNGQRYRSRSRSDSTSRSYRRGRDGERDRTIHRRSSSSSSGSSRDCRGRVGDSRRGERERGPSRRDHDRWKNDKDDRYSSYISDRRGSDSDRRSRSSSSSSSTMSRSSFRYSGEAREDRNYY